MSDDTLKSKLAFPLLLVRIGVALVFFMWALDKLVNPEHAARVFAHFYKIPALSEIVSYVIGGAQMVLILAFLFGAFKKYSYLFIFVLHLVSTLSSYMRYFDPWEGTNLLFFAAIPMLAACWMLWVLRDYDRLWSLDSYLENRKSH